MFCICKESDNVNNNGRRCVIQADTEPQVFPITGDGVEGLEYGTSILPGSILYVVDAGETYIMNEHGTAWNKWGANA